MSTLLYHGTTLDALVSILARDTLMPGYDEALGEGVSFSESLEIAQGFARGNERAFDDTLRTWYGINDEPLPDRRGVVLVVERASFPDLKAVDDLGKNFEREWRTTGAVEGIVARLVRLEVSDREATWYGGLIDRFGSMDGADLTNDRHRGLGLVNEIASRLRADDARPAVVPGTPRP